MESSLVTLPKHVLEAVAALEAAQAQLRRLREREAAAENVSFAIKTITAEQTGGFRKQDTDELRDIAGFFDGENDDTASWLREFADRLPVAGGTTDA